MHDSWVCFGAGLPGHLVMGAGLCLWSLAGLLCPGREQGGAPVWAPQTLLHRVRMLLEVCRGAAVMPFPPGHLENSEEEHKPAVKSCELAAQ